MTNARSLAYDVLKRVHSDGAYSHIALSSSLDRSSLEERDKNLATELLYGTLARQRTIDEVLRRFVSRRLDKLDLPVLLALRMAAYQLMYLDRIPDHAVVHEAVETVKARLGRGASGFVNGVLRAMLRKRHFWEPWTQIDPEESSVRHLAVRHSLPDWIAWRLIEDRGFEAAMALSESFNTRAPIYFRVLEGELEELPETLRPVEGVPGALRAETVDREIDGLLRARKLVVQDLGAQLVGHFAVVEGAKRILDGCAGLGGKALHLATLMPEAEILALDPQEGKLQQLREMKADTALGERIAIRSRTLQDLPQEETGFDLVLVDAPCSGLGVIRRHPETRWRRSVEDIFKLGVVQRDLLHEAARRVAPGGVLVYSVCTFTREEGPEQVKWFLEEHPEFQRDPSPEWVKEGGYLNEAGELSVNSCDHDADGFFAVRLRRQ